MTSARILAGASGYSFKEWKGAFYPDALKAEEMLAFYASRLPTVEINNTFYRMPKTSVLESWASQVPAEFRFAIKASRRITHIARLKTESAAEPVGYLYRGLATLGEKRGPVLFQLPPNLKKDLPRLEAFLGCCPASIAPHSSSATTRGSPTMSTPRSRPPARRCACQSARTTHRPRWSRRRRGATSGCGSKRIRTPT
jgi:uncharacterized protein YecE (DUF72 family)